MTYFEGFFYAIKSGWQWLCDAVLYVVAFIFMNLWKLLGGL